MAHLRRQRLRNKNQGPTNTHAVEDDLENDLIQLKPKLDLIDQLEKSAKATGDKQLKLQIQKERQDLNQTVDKVSSKFGVSFFDAYSKLAAEKFKNEVIELRDKQEQRLKTGKSEEDLVDLVDENGLLLERIKSMKDIPQEYQYHINQFNKYQKGFAPYSERHAEDYEYYPDDYLANKIKKHEGKSQYYNAEISKRLGTKEPINPKFVIPIQRAQQPGELNVVGLQQRKEEIKKIHDRAKREQLQRQEIERAMRDYMNLQRLHQQAKQQAINVKANPFEVEERKIKGHLESAIEEKRTGRIKGIEKNLNVLQREKEKQINKASQKFEAKNAEVFEQKKQAIQERPQQFLREFDQQQADIVKQNDLLRVWKKEEAQRKRQLPPEQYSERLDETERELINRPTNFQQNENIDEYQSNRKRQVQNMSFQHKSIFDQSNTNQDFPGHQQQVIHESSDIEEGQVDPFSSQYRSKLKKEGRHQSVKLFSINPKIIKSDEQRQEEAQLQSRQIFQQIGIPQTQIEEYEQLSKRYKTEQSQEEEKEHTYQRQQIPYWKQQQELQAFQHFDPLMQDPHTQQAFKESSQSRQLQFQLEGGKQGARQRQQEQQQEEEGEFFSKSNITFNANLNQQQLKLQEGIPKLQGQSKVYTARVFKAAGLKQNKQSVKELENKGFQFDYEVKKK